MKFARNQHLRRRDLMRLLGGAAFALPGLELLSGELQAQAPNGAKYAVFCFTPNGIDAGRFWPSGTESDFQLSGALSPFEAHRDKILILGPQLDGTTVVEDTGLAYLEMAPPQHQSPVVLSGRIGEGCDPDSPFGNKHCLPGGRGFPYEDQEGAVNSVSGPSIDQVIGGVLQGESLFSTLNFGLHPVGGDGVSDINFAADGSSLKRMETADEAWDRVFGAPMMPGADHERIAVTEFLHSRFGALRGVVSAHDREVLDAHLTSLRAYEQRIVERGAVVCQEPARREVPTDDTSVRTGADTETLCPLFMDLISTAFACNLTKVASVTFGYPGGGREGGLRMPWLGFTDPLHHVSHHGDNQSTQVKFESMQNWMASQIVSLMDRLAAVSDVDGVPLLDKTVIYWVNRHGDGNAHLNYGLPGIIAGGAGGYFRTGRFLQLPATKPTEVLVSIANSMGVDVPTFGEEPFTATSPLSGLV